MDLYRLSKAAKRVIDQASKEAKALGHDRLETAHVVAALLAVPDRSAASVALGRAGAAIAKLRKAADEGYDGPRGGKARDLDLGYGEMKEAMQVARDEADAAGSHEIQPLHVFLAVTEDEDWSAGRALKAVGVDVEKARMAALDLERDEAQGTLPD